MKVFKMHAHGNDFLLFDIRPSAKSFLQNILQNIFLKHFKPAEPTLFNINEQGESEIFKNQSIKRCGKNGICRESIQKSNNAMSDFEKSDFEKIKNKAKTLADRRFGIGCDQIIVIAKHNFVKDKKIADNNFFITFLNSDGSFSGACGNGSRCAALYLAAITKQNKIALETIDRMLTCRVSLAKSSFLVSVLNFFTPYRFFRELVNNNEVEVEIEMGQVFQDAFQIPLAKTINIDDANNFVKNIFNKNNNNKFLQIADIFFGNIGNPHCVIRLADGDFLMKNYNNQTLIDILSAIGSEIENSTNVFPQKINVEFTQRNSDKSIFFIVWERGAGITLSCGTGASVVGYFFNKTYNTNEVSDEVSVLSSGALIEAGYNSFNAAAKPLKISVNKETDFVTMTGACKMIAEIDILAFKI